MAGVDVFNTLKPLLHQTRSYYVLKNVADRAQTV